MLLWGGQAVSEMGSAITVLALPLTAVVVLRASTFQVGLLTSASTLAFALIALPAGAIVDRRAKRWLMIWCDVARMVIIGSVPLAAAFSVLTFGLPQLIIPLAAPGWRLALFPVGFVAFSFSAVVYNVTQVSYRQAICPPQLLGRMNAAVRWVVWGTLPLGGVLGGAFGTLLGVRATLWIAFAGSWAAGWWVFFSPLRAMRDVLEADRAPGGEVPGHGGGQLPDGSGAQLGD